MSSKSCKQIAQDIDQALVASRKDAGRTMAGFGAMAKAALALGALSELHKALSALALGVAPRCGGCIRFPVKALTSDAFKTPCNFPDQG